MAKVDLRKLTMKERARYRGLRVGGLSPKVALECALAMSEAVIKRRAFEIIKSSES